MDSFKKNGNSRPLKVGEAIRHALSDILIRGELHDPDLADASITVSEVRVSPDLKNATVFVMPLAGAKREEMVEALERASQELRRLAASRLSLRYTPRLHFKLDTSFEEAGRIHALLEQDKQKS